MASLYSGRLRSGILCGATALALLPIPGCADLSLVQCENPAPRDQIKQAELLVFAKLRAEGFSNMLKDLENDREVSASSTCGNVVTLRYTLILDPMSEYSPVGGDYVFEVDLASSTVKRVATSD